MKLRTEQELELDRLSDAAGQLAAAREALRVAVFDAMDAGVPVARIADATGLARTTILRWLATEGEAA